MKLLTKIFAASTAAFLLVVLLGFVSFPAILKHAINSQKALREGNEMYDYYLKLPFPLDFCVYFFNVTNPNEIYEGAVPILKEIGPYCYDAYKEKINKITNDSEDSLSYNSHDTYFYNTNNTQPLSQDDYVTIIHPIMMGMINVVAATVPQFLKIMNNALNPIFSNPQSIFLTAKVRDILFEGLDLNCTGTDFHSSVVCSQIKDRMPNVMEKSKKVYSVSLFGEMNGTSLNRIKVLRGIKTPSQIGEVIEYNNETKLDIWSTKECNQLNGTDGWIFPTFLEDHDTLNIFSTNLCRQVQSNYVEDVDLKGIHARKYHSTLGGDIESNPDEKCYCPTPSTCPKKGLMDLLKCTGFPIYASLPHFLEADQSYLDGVKGLNPKVDDHIIRIIFEPMTAVPIEARKRMQLNFQIKALDEVPLTHNISDVTFPILWFEEGVELKGEFLQQLITKLLVIKIVKVAMWVLFVVSLSGMVLGGFLWYKNKNLVKITNKQKRVLRNAVNGVDVIDKGYLNRAINLTEPDKS